MFDSSSTKDLLDFESMRDDLDSAPMAEPKAVEYIEVCPRCNGSGLYHGFSSQGATCFKCNGAGKLRFKSSAEQRAKNRGKVAERKLNKQEQNLAYFEESYPQIAAWWTGSTFEFAVSLREAVIKYGDLTPNQLASALKCVDKLNAAKAAREANVKNAAPVDISGLELAFTKGQQNSIKKPKLRLVEGENSFVFSLAPSSGRNAGSVYVKADETYLGKIAGGKFFKSFDCSAEMERSIIAACVDPLQAAVAYGRRFGVCSCCGRELTNGESIDLGIGPICRSKFF